MTLPSSSLSSEKFLHSFQRRLRFAAIASTKLRWRRESDKKKYIKEKYKFSLFNVSILNFFFQGSSKDIKIQTSNF